MIPERNKYQLLSREASAAPSLISTFGLAAGPVDEAIAQFKESEGEETQEKGQEEGQKQENEEGKGNNSNGNGNGTSLPAVVKNSEAITPEAIIQHFLYNGSAEWQLRIEGMMLLRAAQKMNREDVEILKGQTGAYAMMMKPILESMIEISREQDAAARRALGSNEEIAQQAAFNVAQHLTPELKALKSQIAASSSPAPDPMSKMLNFVQTLPQMLQAAQQLTQSLGLKMPGLSLPQGQQTAAQEPSPAWKPPPIEKHSVNEIGGENNAE